MGFGLFVLRLGDRNVQPFLPMRFTYRSWLARRAGFRWLVCVCKMTPRKSPLFAPCAFNLAETSRMTEIARGIERHCTAPMITMSYCCFDT